MTATRPAPAPVSYTHLDVYKRQLAACGFDEDAIGAYRFLAGAPEVTRTHGRRPVAFMNVLVDVYKRQLQDATAKLVSGLDALQKNPPRAVLSAPVVAMLRELASHGSFCLLYTSRCV